MAEFVKQITVVNGRVTDVEVDNIDTADMVATAVTPGSYTSADITVDAAGRITAAANGSGGPSLPLSLADGGTGASLADPGTDRLLGWDDGTNAAVWYTVLAPLGFNAGAANRIFLDEASVGYSAADSADWAGGTAPGTVWDALDRLAAALTAAGFPP